ncbi:hypothetical protein E1263_21640 [Kribbella antibiotica]|uniref:Uncharacterized protein n=1 Tax=Kribbella antibiotica TaxID=190195 RepID=A0A4R4ZIL7_9ACTN|nr:hypothetical protein [Kribbella antibiotica]TDD57896.1 hypothetical protein E1263_21640 [Kribbella antibiotica]
MSAPEIAFRHRCAQAILWFLYVVAPVAQVVILVLLEAWVLALLSVFFVVLFWFLRRGNRYDVRYWPVVGATTWGMAALVPGLFGNDHPSWGVLAAVPCAFVGYWLGRLAEWLVMNPLDVRLADSPYRLAFRLRDEPGRRVVIEVTSLVLLTRVKTVEGGKTTSSEEETEVPLTSLRGASVQQLSGGSALVVQSFDDEWILPVDDAVVLGQIIDRRIALLRGTQ